MKDRLFPENILLFLLEHNAFSGMREVINQAKHISCWMSFYFSVSASTACQLVFVEYSVETFELTVSAAGVIVALIGISIAFFAPCMSGLYHDTELNFLGATSAATGQMMIHSIISESYPNPKTDTDPNPNP